ncbi:hypothetical protein ILUMI_01924 [Ignelater luminosus]|uniref:Regulatory protein zeste n=1 Tax=Ignelater luminosus TaxID=2038154 RepID=A0A8K0GLA3_IGNLU|nr:hypothetical protein ILUMI_01924 [Ignelater luminosus]
MNDINKKARRDRAQNYANDETRLLVDIVLEYKHIIENKASDAVAWKEKAEAWQQIADSFNTRNSNGVLRDKIALRQKYESIKKLLKRKIAHEMYRADGGKKVDTEFKDWEKKLAGILQLNIGGLPSTFDCDVVIQSASPPTTEGVHLLEVLKEENTNESMEEIICADKISTDSPNLDLKSSDSPPPINNVSNEQSSTSTATEANQEPSKWDGWSPELLRLKKNQALQKRGKIFNKQFDAVAKARASLQRRGTPETLSAPVVFAPEVKDH